jgi:tetratricopeptide (TPR) repeat protein
MKAKIILSLLFAAFSLTAFAAGDSNYDKAWAAFNTNNRAEARNLFTLAATEPATKADALLSLCLLEWNEGHEAAAHERFKQFYENSDNPYPYIYALFSTSFNSPRKVLTKAQVAFCEQLLADPKMNGTLKAMVAEKLGDHYRITNNFKKSAEYFAQMGTLNKWQVLGSFNNISGSGFNKNWGAVENAMPDAVFKNEVNADVQWYTPTANREDNWFLFDYYFYLNSIIAYAQTFVNSPAAQEVYMRVGTSGSLKIWVNDAQVMSVPEERNCDLDIYACKINLNAGNNRILVQIGQSEISNANFMIRLTDADGNAIKGLTNTPEYTAYTKSEAATPNVMLPFFAEQMLEEKIKAEPANMLGYLMLGEVYLRNDKSFEGTTVLKQAEKFAPKSSFVSDRLSEAFLRAGNRTDYSRERENIKLNDPESLPALTGFYNDAIESEKITEAENYFKKIVQLYGESKQTDEMKIQLAGAQKRGDEVIRLVKEFYAKEPSEFEYAEAYAMVQEYVEQKPKAAIKTIENFHNQYFNSNAIDWLSNKYFTTGNYTKGLAVLRQRIDRMPYATGLIFNYAATLQSMRRFDEALAYIDKVKQQAPFLAAVYSTKGFIYKEKGEPTTAKEMFRRAIYYAPTSYDARTQLRLLEDKPEVFDLFPKYNLDSLIAKAGTTQDYPEENSIIVLNDTRLVFYPEGAEEKHEILAVKILNQSGIDVWKDYQIGYSGSQKLIVDRHETLKANGQKVQAETDGEGRVVFTNLEVGDVLYVEYRLQDYYTGILSKHFFGQMQMQYSRPSMVNRYAILLPKDKEFKYEVTNADIKPTVTEVENQLLYQWESHNQSAIKHEPLAPAMVDIAPSLTFSSIPNWQFISDWYKDLTANKFGENSDFILKNTFSIYPIYVLNTYLF